MLLIVLNVKRCHEFGIEIYSNKEDMLSCTSKGLWKCFRYLRAWICSSYAHDTSSLVERFRRFCGCRLFLQLHKFSESWEILKRIKGKIVEEASLRFLFVQYRGGRQLEQLGKQNREESVREFLNYHYQHFLSI